MFMGLGRTNEGGGSFIIKTFRMRLVFYKQNGGQLASGKYIVPYLLQRS